MDKEERTLRCQNLLDTPWGLAQCALPEDHAPKSSHAYSPTETVERARAGLVILDED